MIPFLYKSLLFSSIKLANKGVANDETVMSDLSARIYLS